MNTQQKKPKISKNLKVISIAISILFIYGIFPVFISLSQSDYQLTKDFQSPEVKYGNKFGDSVAIDGDIIVIGEDQAEVNDMTKAGKAYIFNTKGNLLANPKSLFIYLYDNFTNRMTLFIIFMSFCCLI